MHLHAQRPKDTSSRGSIAVEPPEEQRHRVEEVGGDQSLQGEHRNAPGAGHGGPRGKRSAGEGRDRPEAGLRSGIEEGAKVREAKGQGGRDEAPPAREVVAGQRV